jgi:LacI family transcriptional regulator
LVLNQRSNSVRISDATRQRVLRAALDLDYSPNRLARALRMHKSNTVGIVSFDANDPMAAAFASCSDRYFTAQGYRTTVGDARHDPQLAVDHVRSFVAARVDSILLLASSFTPDTTRLAELRAAQHLPVACIGRDLSRSGIESFVVDYRAGANNAARYLLELGYRHLAVIVGAELYEPDSSDRLEGARQACAGFGVELAAHMVVREDEGGWNPQLGYHSMQQLLAAVPLPEAVLAFDDCTAYGAIRAIYESGMRVPDDIAVVGFDDLAVSAFYNPPLTTVRQPVEQVALAAVNYLGCAMEQLPERPAGCLRFAPQLVVRASTRRPPV